jgi:hypothetical protein
VKSHAVALEAQSVRRGYKASSERALRRGGEENRPLLASSLGMAADPE